MKTLRDIQFQSTVDQLKKQQQLLKMQPAYLRMTTFVLTVLVMVVWFSGTEATYRKPPFNGSIFGKRGATAEYDNANKALSALCEIAIDACQPWFPAQEK